MALDDSRQPNTSATDKAIESRAARVMCDFSVERQANYQPRAKGS